MPQPLHIDDFCEDKARKGDGAFAVAYALLKLARAQEATARATQNLGNADAMTPMGGLEALGAQIEKAAHIIADSFPSN